MQKANVYSHSTLSERCCSDIEEKETNNLPSPYLDPNWLTKSRRGMSFRLMDLLVRTIGEYKNNILGPGWAVPNFQRTNFSFHMIQISTMGQPFTAPSALSPQTSLANLVEFLSLKMTIWVLLQKVKIASVTKSSFNVMKEDLISCFFFHFVEKAMICQSPSLLFQ